MNMDEPFVNPAIYDTTVAQLRTYLDKVQAKSEAVGVAIATWPCPTQLFSNSYMRANEEIRKITCPEYLNVAARALRCQEDENLRILLELQRTFGAVWASYGYDIPGLSVCEDIMEVKQCLYAKTKAARIVTPRYTIDTMEIDGPALGRFLVLGRDVRNEVVNHIVAAKNRYNESMQKITKEGDTFAEPKVMCHVSRVKAYFKRDGFLFDGFAYAEIIGGVKNNPAT